jgi:hypothetical protein
LLQKIKESYGVEHISLWLQDKIYLCSPAWHSIHEADKVLLNLYRSVNNDSIINDIPVFLTHTSLVDDINMIGRVPYRYVIMHLSDLFTVTLVSDPSLEINDLYYVRLLIRF